MPMMASANDTDTMARTVWGEARGEGEPGMVAVAWVIRNRLSRLRRFGATLAQVCRQPWAFSAWNQGDPNRSQLLAVTDADPQFRQAQQIVSDVLADRVADPTMGSQFYLVTGTAADWAIDHAPVVEIGRHSFFNDVQ